MSRAYALVWCLVLGSLCGCSYLHLQPSKPKVLQLLSPLSGPQPSVRVQRLTMEAQDQSQQFVVVTRIQPNRVQMQALLPTGQTLIKLEYDGQDVRVEQAASIELPANDMLAIMQLAIWPLESMIQGYPVEAGWRVIEAANQRVLMTGDHRYITVEYKPNSFHIENHRDGYKVHIEDLESTFP